MIVCVSFFIQEKKNEREGKECEHQDIQFRIEDGKNKHKKHKHRGSDDQDRRVHEPKNNTTGANQTSPVCTSKKSHAQNQESEREREK